MEASVYIHIPFCKQICSYCDFCKMYYKEEWADCYLQALRKEIDSNLPKRVVRTIYIGGGTPSSLSYEQLKYLLEITDNFLLSEDYEFTVECNIEQITEEKIKLLKKHGVNRISYGIESFQEKHLAFLNRHHTISMVKNIIAMTKCYIPNINVDFIYALPSETLEEVKEDITEFLELNIPHISTYSLIIEPNTVLGNKKIEPIDDELDVSMYEVIDDILERYGYLHYEISNYAKPGYESKHNLTYWNNQEYYGYGLGASGYLDGVRYTNTRSLNHYLSGKYRLEEESLTERRKMEDEMMLGLRKLDGVSKQKFKRKFNCDMEEEFPIKKLIEKGLLEAVDDKVRIPKEYQYLSNEVLVSFIGEE